MTGGTGDAAQMHARLKPATPASRLARVNCSIVVSPINISFMYSGPVRLFCFFFPPSAPLIFLGPVLVMMLRVTTLVW